MTTCDGVDASTDRIVGRVARDGVDLVDRRAWPLGPGERVARQQEHRAPERLTFLQERVALEIGGDAKNRQHLYSRHMRREVHRWYSDRVGRDLSVVVLGHWGPPMIMF